MKRWLKTLLVTCLALLAGLYAATSWIGAGWLVMPPRRPLDTWQTDRLTHPAAFGMRVECGISTKGTPYLLCVPNAAAGPSGRGQILRAQLAAAKAPLRPFGEIAGTVVLLHGWGGRKENMLAVAERFCAAGLRCVIPDLPGHGENPAPSGGFCTRADETALPREVLESAAMKFHFARRPSGVWGLSMGGAFAISAAAAEADAWDAAVVVSSFDALEPVVSGEIDHATRGLAALMNLGLALAVRWRGGFWLGSVRPVDRARRLTLPTLIVHGTTDEVIPLQRGRNLFAAVPDAKKEWLAVDGGLHGNVLGTPQHVFAAMTGWYLRWMNSPAGATAQADRSARNRPTSAARIAGNSQ